MMTVLARWLGLNSLSVFLKLLYQKKIRINRETINNEPIS
jgi:hypothetical protein